MPSTRTLTGTRWPRWRSPRRGSPLAGPSRPTRTQCARTVGSSNPNPDPNPNPNQTPTATLTLTPTLNPNQVREPSEAEGRIRRLVDRQQCAGL